MNKLTLTPELIVELANSHDGSEIKLKKLIKEVTKFNYQNKSIKFQIFSPDTISLNDYEWYEVYKKITFNKAKWKKIIKSTSKKIQKVWIDIFDSYGVEVFKDNKSLIYGIKLQSSVLENYEVRELLEKIDVKKIKLIINVSGYDLEQITKLINEFDQINFREIILQIGFQSYPTKIEDTSLNKISILRENFRNKICLADHIDGNLESAIDIPINGIACGATLIEKHICLNRKKTKYDYFSSLEPREFLILINKINNYLKASTGLFLKKSEVKYLNNSIQIPVLRNPVSAGSLISLKDLKFRRTNQKGMSYSEIKKTQNKFMILKDNLSVDLCLRNKDFQAAKIGVIIAGRLKSSRLERKALLPIHEKLSIQWCYETCMTINSADEYILATSNLPEDADLEDTIKFSKKMKIYKGDPDDVISRYLGACAEYKIDVVIRVTADCPFISEEIAEILLKEHFENGADYTAARNFAVGTSCEIINTSALKSVIKYFGKAALSEYMTWYFQNNSKVYKVNIIDLPSNLIRDYRLTLDYKEDLEMFKKLLQKLGKKPPTTRNIFKVLDENPKINAINSHISLIYKSDKALIRKLNKQTRITI